MFAAIYKSMKKHAHEQKARQILGVAVRKGVVNKPKHCERCTKTKIEGHHDDYAKPLDVRWLCRPHHADVHRELNAIV